MEQWKNGTYQVLLAKFLDSDMEKDADKKYSFVKDFYRAKTYTKPEEMLIAPHLRDFSEPYQVASHYCGGTWNEYNEIFLIQVGGCNLNCNWCFVPETVRKGENGKYFTADEVVSWWETYCNTKNPPQQHGVLRISGGEPFLTPTFIVEVAKVIAQRNLQNRCYLWIDTNLLGLNYDSTLQQLNEMPVFYGICGCFKGFSQQDFVYNTGSKTLSLENQLQNARSILNTIGTRGQPFFYIPEITQPMNDCATSQIINNFFNKLRSIHPLLPLRVTILRIKAYESNKMTFDSEHRYDTLKTKHLWLEKLQSEYTPTLLWLPQFQIPFRDEKS